MLSKVFCVVTVLFALTSLTTALAQTAPSEPTASNRGWQKQRIETSAEEKIIRAAYEKLTKLNQAALYRIETESADLSDEKKFLKFQLSNFRIGPIQEILSAKYTELTTQASGEIVNVHRIVSMHNNSEEHVAFEASWDTSQYAAVYDPGWTVGDLMGFEAKEYYNVGAFALYNVTVSFQGKSRAYRTLALFHNPYGSVEDLKPTFWDTVGAGGKLTQVWNEKRPPRSHKLLAPTDKMIPLKSSTTRNPEPLQTTRHHPRLLKSVSLRSIAELMRLENPGNVTESYSTSENATDSFTSSISDFRDHIMGFHGLTKVWKGLCFSLPAGLQSCQVESFGTVIVENGTINTLLFYHRWDDDQKNVTATGPAGTPITCERGHGLAVRYCINPGCTFTGTLTGSGISMQMTGGDVLEWPSGA